MKTQILTIFLFFSFFYLNAQLKVATDGKVAIEGSATNYGGLQINKDGYTNGIAFSQSDNYGSNPFRIFRNGLTGYITMDNVTNQYSGFRMSQDGKIAMGGIPSCWSFMGQLAVFGNNFSAMQTRFYYPANNGGDGISSAVLQPNNNTFAGWYMPVGGTYEKTFYVTGVGNAYCSGNFIGLSDESIKSDIKSIESPLSIIQQLQGVSYKNDLREKIKKDHINNITEKDRAFVDKDSLYDKVYADKLMAEYDKRDMGLIAQQVEKVLPDIVYTINGDKKGIAYTQLIALLIEGVKEQQKQINILFETVATLQGLSETKSLSLGSANIVTSMNAQTKTEIPLLEQNTPNPFSMQTQISYYLPSKVTDAQLRLYNLNGHQLRSIKLTERGYGNITIMANELEAGIYLYSLIVEGKEISCKRMILTD